MNNHPIIQSSNHPILNRWDIAKLIALALMFVDHAGYFYFEQSEWLRGIGRGAAPIFMFLTGLAAHYRFSRTLLLWAVALTVSDWLVLQQPNTLNILWTILICRGVLFWLEKRGQKLRLHEWAIGCIIWFPLLWLVEYGAVALLLSLSGYVYKHRAQYAANTPIYFLLTCLFIHGATDTVLAGFASLTIFCMIITLAGVAWLLHNTATKPARSFAGPALLKFTAKQSGAIYALHLIALGWLTGKGI